MKVQRRLSNHKQGGIAKYDGQLILCTLTEPARNLASPKNCWTFTSHRFKLTSNISNGICYRSDVLMYCTCYCSPYEWLRVPTSSTHNTLGLGSEHSSASHLIPCIMQLPLQHRIHASTQQCQRFICTFPTSVSYADPTAQIHQNGYCCAYIHLTIGRPELYSCSGQGEASFSVHL